MGRRFREAVRAARWWAAMVLAPWDDPSEDPHPFTVVNGIQLDNGVVSLVEWCWEQGIETFNSCEGSLPLHTIVRSQRSAPMTGFEAYVTVGSVGDAETVSAALAPFEGGIPPAVTHHSGSPYWFVSFSPSALRAWETHDRVTP